MSEPDWSGICMASVLAGADKWAIVHADCRFALEGIPDSSLDAVVCDPPYHLTQASRGGSPRQNDPGTPYGRTRLGTAGFMGKTWDGGDIAFDPALWREVRRVCKPGAHLVAFGGTRTWHRLAVAIEDAGWEIRDSLGWIQGQGFPKSLDVSKAIDEKLGGGEVTAIGSDGVTRKPRAMAPGGAVRSAVQTVSLPSSQEATAWDGFGTALKPAIEPIVLARNPLTNTVAENVLQHGTGALNIDGCRVAGRHQAAAGTLGGYGGGRTGQYEQGTGRQPTDFGRWPPNVLLGHSPWCRRQGMKRVAAAGGDVADETPRANAVFGDLGAAPEWRAHGNGDGTEDVEAWDCAPGCPVAALDAQSGECPAGIAVQRNGGGGQIWGSPNGRGPTADAGYADTGTASRFFPQFQVEYDAPFYYTPKAPTHERELGLDGQRCTHPTVKPIALMEWLVTLVTPPGGVVLDPFAGSGTTVLAAARLGFRAIGIEREAEYVEQAERRVAHVAGGRWAPLGERAETVVAPDGTKKKQLLLF